MRKFKWLNIAVTCFVMLACGVIFSMGHGGKAYATGVSPDDIDLVITGGTEGEDYEFVYDGNHTEGDNDHKVVLNILTSGTFSISMKEGVTSSPNRLRVINPMDPDEYVTPETPPFNVVLKLNSISLSGGEQSALEYIGPTDYSRDPAVRDSVELVLNGENYLISESESGTVDYFPHLILSGGGSLNVQGDDNVYGTIYSRKLTIALEDSGTFNVTGSSVSTTFGAFIQGGTIEINSSYNGFHSSATYQQTGGDVTINAAYSGISVDAYEKDPALGVSIEGDANLTINGTDVEAWGIQVGVAGADTCEKNIVIDTIGTVSIVMQESYENNCGIASDNPGKLFMKNGILSIASNGGQAVFKKDGIEYDGDYSHKNYAWDDSETPAEKSDTEMTPYIVGQANKNNILIEPTAATFLYKAGTGGSVDPEKEAVALDGGAAQGSIATADEGYQFKNWTDTKGNVVGTEAKFVPQKIDGVYKSAKYTANFEEKEDPKPDPKPGPKPSKKTSGILLARMVAKGSSKFRIDWTKINGADGYDIFFAPCNTKTEKYDPELIKTINGNATFVYTRTGLRKKTLYKCQIKAFVMEDGKKRYVSTSLRIHACSAGSNKSITNPKSVKVKKTKVSLKKGKTYKIKASVTKLKGNKKLITKAHAPKLRYLSTKPGVAKVSGSGKIKGVKKGSCTVYAISVSGVRKAIKVKVK